MTKLSHAASRLMLAKQRQMTSLMDKEIAAESTEIVFHKEDWVPLYFDRGNMVTSDCGHMTAYRAITMKGQLLWLVFTSGKTKGFHATGQDPFDAMDEARHSLTRRRVVRHDWDQVETTARDLMMGRKKFDVRIEDVYASPLCAMGIEGFRSAVGMGRINRIPGRLAALLMKIEPQMGFVINAAMQRHEAAQMDAADEIATGIQA